MNTANTTFIMDVGLLVPTGVTSGGSDTTHAYSCRFQNNIQSIFNRVRVLYGATPIEDLINYNVIVRFMTEWTTNSPQGTMDQSSIDQGIGGITRGVDGSGNEGLVNVRTAHIQGVSGALPTNGFNVPSVPTLVTFTPIAGNGNGYIPHQTEPLAVPPSGSVYVTRRYQFQIAAGLFQQPKLIPLKYMASQFAVEFTLEQPQACIVVSGVGASFATYAPTYIVGNCWLLSETLTFDPSYDEAILQGLYTNGVPIKGASWHTFLFSSALASTCNLQIQERARSVKALFALQRRAQPNYLVDNGASFMDTAHTTNGGPPSSLQQYQWRIGSRYFPGAPVQCSTNNGSGTSNGCVEAYTELAKALNIIGDYSLSTPTNVRSWSNQTTIGRLQEFDYTEEYTGFAADGTPIVVLGGDDNTDAFASTLSAQHFAMAINLETTNGVEISGLNAEEQSDIVLSAQWKMPQVTGATNPVLTSIVGDVPSSLEVYSFFDFLFLLKENNQAVVVN